jgi:hypothetical protein
LDGMVPPTLQKQSSGCLDRDGNACDLISYVVFHTSVWEFFVAQASSATCGSIGSSAAGRPFATPLPRRELRSRPTRAIC